MMVREGYHKAMQMLLRIPSSDVCCLTQELDRWEERLEELFAGRPYDIYDAALTATISDFPVSIQPFRDMVGHCLYNWIRQPEHLRLVLLLYIGAQLDSDARADVMPADYNSGRQCAKGMSDQALAHVQIDGMRMDLVKPRYETFDELYEYCYKVAGTVGLMTTPVMGVDPAYKVCHSLLS